MLVSTSFFPIWEADGAVGPWRATPNLMVVVPTREEVTLRYGRTPVDVVAILLTVAGLVALGVLARRPRPDEPPSAWYDGTTLFPAVNARLDAWVDHRIEPPVDHPPQGPAPVSLAPEMNPELEP